MQKSLLVLLVLSSIVSLGAAAEEACILRSFSGQCMIIVSYDESRGDIEGLSNRLPAYVSQAGLSSEEVVYGSILCERMLCLQGCNSFCFPRPAEHSSEALLADDQQAMRQIFGNALNQIFCWVRGKHLVVVVPMEFYVYFVQFVQNISFADPPEPRAQLYPGEANDPLDDVRKGVASMSLVTTMDA